MQELMLTSSSRLPRPCVPPPRRPCHLLPGGPKAAEGSMTCRALGPLLMAGGSRERAASAR